MAITALRVTDFRNLAAAELNLNPHGLNIICGKNGSGKTSLLEAIYYLGHGRSFRSSTSGQLIRRESDKFLLFIQLLSGSLGLIPLGIERGLSGNLALRVAEKDAVSISELAQFLPIRVINSQSHHLFESGPSYRRKFLDWGLFYHYESFFNIWRHFERALKQRNTILKERRTKRELDSWTAELVKHANELNTLRQDYTRLFSPVLAELARELLGIDNLAISYHPGWDELFDYETILANHTQDEFRLGSTQYGPHRADLDITVDGLSIRHFLSRGQQKMLICAMIVAQGMVLNQYVNKRLIYLVDDLPSELDELNRQKLISLLTRQESQIFITAIENDAIYDSICNEFKVPMKVFHVEHGNVSEVTNNLSIGQ
jgi:DNA replication and repair protein RecF